MNSVGCALKEIVLAWDKTSSSQPTRTRDPFGTWIEDNTGRALIYGRIYTFNPDGTYALVLTSRPKGSTIQTVVARESGPFIRV